MGKAKREHRERVENGLEAPFRQVLDNRIVRGAVKLASRQGVVEELRRGTTAEQVGKLDELVGAGVLPDSALKKALMSKAPKEMDKGIRKMQKEGKKVTVEALLEDAKATPGFLTMCGKVGLDIAWFEKLAKDRMLALGITGE